jgi:prepilin peptidase CpaA
LVPISPADFAVFAVLAAALVTDLRWQRVPNPLTFGTMALGLVLALVQGGILASILGILVAFAMMFPGWRFGGAVRAGDAKLLMAVGAFYGPLELVRACLLTYILNFPFGLTVLLFKGRLRNVVPAVRAGIQRALGNTSVPEPTLTVVPMVPVVVGAVLLTRFSEVLKWW